MFLFAHQFQKNNLAPPSTQGFHKDHKD